MRTLQEKYNGIQEGKFSKEQFLVEARMQQPQLITRFNGYDDAVQILKNRGIIVEVKKQDGKKVTDYPFIVYTDKQGKHHTEEQNYEDDRKAFLKTIPNTWDVYETRKEASAELQRRLKQDKKETVKEAEEKKYYHLIKGSKKHGENRQEYVEWFNNLKDAQYVQNRESNYDPENYYQIVITKSQEQPSLNKENVNEAKQPKATKKGLADYRYKPTNEMDKYPYEQILRGIRVELEAAGVLGTPTPEEYTKALAKVSKNLEKDSIFYTNQVAGVNPKVDLHDKMVTATAKNTVDTFNGMKKAELKEGFKKLIKKVLSEDAGKASRGVEYGQTSEDEYEFYSNPENYNKEKQDEEGDQFELQGDLEESAIGDLHILAQEANSLKDFLIAVKQQHPEIDLRGDIEDLKYVWDNRVVEVDELSEGRKSLSELLK